MRKVFFIYNSRAWNTSGGMRDIVAPKGLSHQPLLAVQDEEGGELCILRINGKPLARDERSFIKPLTPVKNTDAASAIAKTMVVKTGLISPGEREAYRAEARAFQHKLQHSCPIFFKKHYQDFFYYLLLPKKPGQNLNLFFKEEKETFSNQRPNRRKKNQPRCNAPPFWRQCAITTFTIGSVTVLCLYGLAGVALSNPLGWILFGASCLVALGCLLREATKRTQQKTSSRFFPDSPRRGGNTDLYREPANQWLSSWRA